MIDIKKMRAELERDEGRRLRAYDDATGLALMPGYTLVGNATVGVGRALVLRGLSDREVDTLLANDILDHIEELDDYPWFLALDPARQRALVNMCHQLGISGLLKFRAMIAAIARSDYPAAAVAGWDSAWAKQTPDRAARVLVLLEYGEPMAA